MKNEKQPRGWSVFSMVVIGFFVGLIFAVVTSMITLYSFNLPITLQNIIQLQITLPIFWWIDLMAVLLAILIGFLVAFRGENRDLRKQVSRLSKQMGDLEQLKVTLEAQEKEHKDLEAVIGRAKQQWEGTFDSLEDMVVLADEQGVISRCNLATGYMFKTGFRQLIGKQVDELFPGIIGAGQDQSKAQKAEMKFPRLEGWYEVLYNPLIAEGNQLGKVYVIRNITERKETELNLHRLNQYYELLVNNSPIAIVTLSLDNRIVSCNPAFETLFGYNRREVIGQELDYLISSPELLADIRALNEGVLKGEVVRMITKRRRCDGSLFDVEVFGIPVVLWGKQIGVIGLYHDVSELMQSQTPAEPMVYDEVQNIVQPEAPEQFEEESWSPEISALGVAAAGILGAQMASDSQEALPAEVEAAVEAPLDHSVETSTTEPVIEAETIIPENDQERSAAEALALGVMAADLTNAGYETAPVEAGEATEAERSLPEFLLIEQEAAFVEPSQDVLASEPIPLPGKPKARTVLIEKIEGIGPVYVAKLAELGIKTTADLLNFAASRKGREELVEKTGISSKLVLKWVNMADLMRVPGIGEEYSELLEVAGVDTVKELRNRNPQNLYYALADANEKRPMVRRLPHLSEVTNWVMAARELEPLMTY